jgi:F-type H+-transporting ATPase subunit delta
MASALETRYAKALADVVLKPGSQLTPADAVKQIRAFEEAYASSPDLGLALASPAVPGGKKRAVLAQLAGILGLSKLIVNFLYVVSDHRRVGEIGRIRQAFETVVDERTGVVRADITSAQEMNPGQRQALEGELKKLTGKQVRAEYAVNPELIGGAVARTGSTIYDGSVKGQLEALRRMLTAV